MASSSKIEWTEQTWNPVVGCSLVSPGCTNCYAMRDAWRMHRNPGTPHYRDLTRKVNGKPVWTGKLARAPESVLLAPLNRKTPTMYFVNSMGDLFHEDCPDEWIDQVFAVMALAPQHTFQVLTKRAKRMREYFANDDVYARVSDEALSRLHLSEHPDGRFVGDGEGGVEGLSQWPLPNVWLGVSTERQQEADERIPELLRTPAAVRFISAEPLLGPLDLWQAHWGDFKDNEWQRDGRALVDWVIAGGESGPNARPMEPDWPRALRDQCGAVGVPFFFKQWGQHKPIALKDNHQIKRRKFYFNGRGFSFHQIENYALVNIGKKAAGRLLDGVEHNGFPKVSA